MKLLPIAAVLALAVPAAPQALALPRPDRHVTDRTGRLDTARMAVLSSAVAADPARAVSRAV
jgi:uncharacterized membrane protein YgcG